MRRTLLRPALLTLAAFALSACAEVIIADRTVSINKAVEQANNRLLLLNAIRASQRHPLYFAKVTSVNVSDPLTAGLSFPIPFGGDATNAFKLSPSLSGVKSGLSYTYEPLDDSKFIAAINKQVSLATFRRLLQQGWPESFIFHILVRKISLTPTKRDIINEAYQQKCRDKKFEIEKKSKIEKKSDIEMKSDIEKKLDKFCKEIQISKEFHAGILDNSDFVKENCEEQFAQILDKTNPPDENGNNPPQKNGKLHEFVNTPDDTDPENDEIVLPCRYLAFQELVRRIRIVEFDFKKIPNEDLDSETDKEFEIVQKLTIKKNGSPTEIRETSKRKEEPKLGLSVLGSKADQPSNEDHSLLAEKGTKNKNLLFLRSPEDMVFYLGQLVRAKTAFKPPFSPEVAFGKERDEKNIFEVTLGANSAAPVEVTFLDKTYHIPAGSRRSMHTLSLVNQMILLQQSEKEPAGPQDVRVINQ